MLTSVAGLKILSVPSTPGASVVHCQPPHPNPTQTRPQYASGRSHQPAVARSHTGEYCKGASAEAGGGERGDAALQGGQSLALWARVAEWGGLWVKVSA